MTIISIVHSRQHKELAPHQPPITLRHVILQNIIYKLQYTYIIYEKIKNITILQLFTAMQRKLNDGHKHKTVYSERAQYLDKSYRLNLLLKLRTLSHETISFSKSFETDAERLQQKIIQTLPCKNFLVILKLGERVFELLGMTKIILFQINKLMENLTINQPRFA